MNMEKLEEVMLVGEVECWWEIFGAWLELHDDLPRFPRFILAGSAKLPRKDLIDIVPFFSSNLYLAAIAFV
jgi:hypothetical protein